MNSTALLAFLIIFIIISVGLFIWAIVTQHKYNSLTHTKENYKSWIINNIQFQTELTPSLTIKLSDTNEFKDLDNVENYIFNFYKITNATEEMGNAFKQYQFCYIDTTNKFLYIFIDNKTDHYLTQIPFTGSYNLPIYGVTPGEGVDDLKPGVSLITSNKDLMELPDSLSEILHGGVFAFNCKYPYNGTTQFTLYNYKSNGANYMQYDYDSAKQVYSFHAYTQ